MSDVKNWASSIYHHAKRESFEEWQHRTGVYFQLHEDGMAFRKTFLTNKEMDSLKQVHDWHIVPSTCGVKLKRN